MATDAELADAALSGEGVAGLLALFEPLGLHPTGAGWQQRKSAQTRVKLLEAAIDCLATNGYARTTMQLVAETAGISRGAMLHHYRTKGLLIEAIIAYCFFKRMEMLAEGVGNISEMQRIQEFAGLKILWRSYFTREHRAYLELAIAARTDPELSENFLPQARRFARIWREAGVKIFSEWAGDPERLARASDLAEAVLEGMALNQDMWNSPQRVERLRGFLRHLVGQIYSGELNFPAGDARPSDDASQRFKVPTGVGGNLMPDTPR